MHASKPYLYPVIMASLLTLACLPLLVHGPQMGHSVVYNLTWTNGFTEQLLQGELYPRWLLNHNAGAGSPVFFFYAPVPFYFTAIGSLICGECSATVQLGIGEWLLVLCSGFSFFFFARQYAIPLFAMIGAILYALAPYHFAVDLLERQAIGETSAYIWIPLILLSIDRMAMGRNAVAGLAVSYALLVMSHLPSALLFSVFLLPYVLIKKYYMLLPGLMARFFSGIVIGLMLAGIYLLPAILSLKHISADQLWTDYYYYYNWFFLDGINAPNGAFEHRLLKVLLTATVVFIPAWFIAYKYHVDRQRALVSALLLIVAGAWFMMLPGSRAVWELVPVLQKVQFPWRMIVIVDFAVVATVVLALQCVHGTNNRRLFLVPLGAAALFLAASVYMSTGDYRQQWNLVDDEGTQAHLKSQIAIGRDAPEYIPGTVQLHRRDVVKVVKTLDRVVSDSTAGEVSVTGWHARNIQLETNLARETDILVRQFYYPGWQATLDDNETALSLDAAGSEGLIHLKAPHGRHHISLVLHPLREEMAGKILSAIGLLAVIALLGNPGLQQIRSRRLSNRGLSDAILATDSSPDRHPL